jgi:hypothetical protein
LILGTIASWCRSNDINPFIVNDALLVVCALERLHVRAFVLLILTMIALYTHSDKVI